jgi:hypothetical protein
MKNIRGPVAALVLITALLVGLCAFTAPAKAAPVPAAAVTIDWGKPTTTAPKNRVIEVVDKIKPSAWRVGAAVTWLDRYTASDMRLVSKCSGKAFRCITIRTGKNKSSPGYSSGNTITIDLKRTGAMSRYYRYDKHRTWLLIHELGHQHNLGHSSGSNAMNQYVNRYRLALTASQKKALRSR